MTAPCFYIVADCDAFALDENGVPFGAPVDEDGNVDWNASYDFDPCEGDVEYIAHMCYHLTEMAKLYQEHNVEVFSK